MKILYLTPGCFDKGGISRYNRYQITALRELFGDKNVRVLSLYGPAPGDFEGEFNVTWHGTGLNSLSIMNFTFQLFRQALSWKPNLILIAHVNFSGLGKIASKLSGGGSVLNTYGLEVWSGLKNLPEWGLRTSDHVISDCHYTARYLEDNGFRSPKSVDVIWDCVDLARFNPGPVDIHVAQKYNIPDPLSHQIILSLGRISKAAAHKGYDRLIKAFSFLHERHPEARLVFAGKGDLIEELKKLAASVGIQHKVTFTGMVDEADLPAIYRLAYAFSLASDRGKGRGEGIPLTPLEAMACRVPIIVGNHDGSQEAVVGERNGYVIDSLSIEQHASVLDQLLIDPLLRDNKAASAVEIARKFFSYDGFKKKHADVLLSYFNKNSAL
jgi:phosphatidyl-myo-inositol dimannoside synthase